MAEIDELNKQELHQRWLETKANFAVEGIEFTDEEQAVFAHVIEQGMDEDQSAKYMAAYLAGKVAPPNHDPAA